MTVVGRAIVPLILSGDPDHGSVVTGNLFDELCAAELIAEIDRDYGRDPAARSRRHRCGARRAVPGGSVHPAARGSPAWSPPWRRSARCLQSSPPWSHSSARRGGPTHSCLLGAGGVATRRAAGPGLRPRDVRRVRLVQAATMAVIAATAGVPAGSSSAGCVDGYRSTGQRADRSTSAPCTCRRAGRASRNPLLSRSGPGRRRRALNPAEVLRSEACCALGPSAPRGGAARVPRSPGWCVLAAWPAPEAESALDRAITERRVRAWLR